jgi:hypothetical protein
MSRVHDMRSGYGSDNPGTLTNLARMLNHGRLAGSGKMVVLPIDQGFEHGPARSFAPNPPAYMTRTTTTNWRLRPAVVPMRRRSVSWKLEHRNLRVRSP